MRVRDVMAKQTSCCGPDASLAAAAECMWKNGVGFLPIVGEGGNVIGVITDRDISIALGTGRRRPSAWPVKDVMVPKLFTCTPEEDVHCALKTLRAQRIRRLPVIDREGALLGVFSINDVALKAHEPPSKNDVSYRDVVDTYQAIRGRVASHRRCAAA
jgi:CBS domain-containing protein